MIGAVALAANGALRGGAGLVTFAAPETVQLTIATACLCATSVPLPCDETGALGPEAVREAARVAERCDVLAVGPGMGVGRAQQNVIRALVGQSKPIVIDADGLNNLPRISNWAVLRSGPLILTPHPGEFARLVGTSIGDVQANREAAAVEAARRWAENGDARTPLICVLKGAGTVVTDGRRVYVNTTGNPGMATGGSGDVLTGLLAALLGARMEAFEAAVLAVNVHGRAGDLAAGALGEASVTAEDLLDYLPAALKEAVA